MYVKVRIDCGKATCGRCRMKEQQCIYSPEDYSCELFGDSLVKKSGTWQSGLSFYRLEKCKKSEINIK